MYCNPAVYAVIINVLCRSRVNKTMNRLTTAMLSEILLKAKMITPEAGEGDQLNRTVQRMKLPEKPGRPCPGGGCISDEVSAIESPSALTWRCPASRTGRHEDLITDAVRPPCRNARSGRSIR